jgi:hypothetical protein
VPEVPDPRQPHDRRPSNLSELRPLMTNDDYDHPRIWCGECGEPMKCHMPDCPVLNKEEE